MAAPSLGWLGEGRMYHTIRSLSLRGHAGTLYVVRTQSAALRIYVKETVTLLVNNILFSENPGPFSVKYYKKYSFV